MERPDRKSRAAGADGVRRTRRLIRITFVSLLAAYLLWFVWPTPYHYRYATILGRSVLVRTYRLTGVTYAAQSPFRGGWRAFLANPFECRVAWTRLERQQAPQNSQSPADPQNGRDPQNP